MEKALVDYIIAQRAEADEYSKNPDCWMGKLPCHTDTDYWNDRVPTGTLAEYERITLVEDAYYITADHTSKSYARSLEFHKWTDDKIIRHINQISKLAEVERAEKRKEKEAEEARLDKLAADIEIDRETLDRWMDQNDNSSIGDMYATV